MLLKYGAASLLMVVASASFAQEFRARVFDFTAEMEPRQIGDSTANCLASSGCSKGLKAIAAYVGVPAEAIDVAGVLSALTYNRSGEETRYNLSTSSGYQTCRISVDVYSTIPLTGARASTLDVAVHPDRIHLVSWTPMQNEGGGRSRVDATITLLEVRNSDAQRMRSSGKCHPTPDRVWVYRCRGNVGDGSGRTACGSFRD
jgi:hypothetical protein